MIENSSFYQKGEELSSHKVQGRTSSYSVITTYLFYEVTEIKLSLIDAFTAFTII
jgi:hypothetical protein